MKQDDIVDICSEVTEKDLREYAATHERTTKRPRCLRPHEILIADKVFQRRDWTANIGNHLEHVRGFLTNLRETEKPFEAVTVVSVGDKWYLVDGHYRMIAYRTLKYQHSIPVRVLDCDIEGAWLESLRLNVKHGLPMTAEERSEAAWRLVKEGRMLRHDIVRETNVSRSTAANMRRMLAEMQERGEDAAELTWKQALSGKPREDFDADAYRAKAVAEMQRKLLGALGPGIVKRADYLAEALSLAYPGLPGALVEHWPEAVQAMQDEREACGSLDI